MWDSKPAICNSQVSQGRWMSCEKTKTSQYEATEQSKWLESFSGSQDISTISSSHYSNRKAAGHCSMVRLKEVCSHRIDCRQGRKPIGSTRAEEKPIRDTACRLRADCVEKGWMCDVIPIKVGCRGFLGHSVISFLSKIGITGHSLKVASNCLQTAAQYASSWIWSKATNFQHEGNTRGTIIPVWLRKKQLL